MAIGEIVYPPAYKQEAIMSGGLLRRGSGGVSEVTYKSWIDVGTEARATFFTVGAATTTYVERHDNTIAFLEELRVTIR